MPKPTATMTPPTDPAWPASPPPPSPLRATHTAVLHAAPPADRPRIQAMLDQEAAQIRDTLDAIGVPPTSSSAIAYTAGLLAQLRIQALGPSGQRESTGLRIAAACQLAEQLSR